MTSGERYRLSPFKLHSNQVPGSTFNSSMLSDAFMPWKTRPSLVLIMPCCLFGAKPLSEPIQCQLDTWEQTSGTFESKYQNFDLKYCLKNGKPFCFSLNVSSSIEDSFSRALVHKKQGKSEGFDSCDRPSNLKLDSNRQFFRPCDREIWQMNLQNNRAPLLCYFKLCASFRIHWWIQTWVTVRKRSIRVKIDNFFSCDLEILRMTLKNNRAPLLCYFKLCASFRTHWWIQT